MAFKTRLCPGTARAVEKMVLVALDHAWEGLRACDTEKQGLLARRRLTGRTDRDKETKKKLRRIE